MNWLDFLDRGRTASFRSTSNRNTTFVTIASKPTARARSPPKRPRGAGPRWPPRAWPHTKGTAHASCTKRRAGTRRDTPGTARGRSRSQIARSPGTAAKLVDEAAREPVPALEALLPLPPHLVVTGLDKTVQGCRAWVPRPVQATRLCGQDDAPCLPQRGRTSEHALILLEGQGCSRTC